jgi:hypothetical protein
MLFRLARFLCAPEGDPSGGGGGAAPAPVTPPAPDGAPAATPPAAAAPDLSALLTRLDRLQNEIVDMRREGRKAPVASPAPVAGAPAATPGSPTWDDSTRWAFRDAIEDAGLSLNRERRSILETLARGEGVTSGFETWAAAKAVTLGWKRADATATAASQTPATPPVVQTPVPVVAAPAVRAPDTGAPAGTAAGATTLPDDFSLIPQSVVDKMTPAEALAHYNRVMSKRQGGGHPYAPARAAAEAGRNPTQALVSALTEALANTRK